jgi:hypothetical protein
LPTVLPHIFILLLTSKQVVVNRSSKDPFIEGILQKRGPPNNSEALGGGSSKPGEVCPAWRVIIPMEASFNHEGFIRRSRVPASSSVKIDIMCFRVSPSSQI